MSRNNRLIELVFSNINRRKDHTKENQQYYPNSVDKFLETDQFLGLSESPHLTRYKNIYNEIINKISDDLNMLSDLEEIITQLRCLKFVPKDFKLSITGDYIYVKVLFYRNHRKIKDIRVIAGKTSEYGKNLKALEKDKTFINMFTAKIIDQMNKEIDETVKFIEPKIINSYIYV